MTDNGIAVLKARYLLKNEKLEVIETPDDMFRRVCDAIAKAEEKYPNGPGVADTAQKFYDFITSGTFMPNSPTLMNAGRGSGLLSACFVLPVEDSIDGIFSSIKNAALIQKSGGGTGFSFSRLRPSGDRVASSNGTTSGPISFMKVFSTATSAIQQGAFRRGANMGVMRVDHPDVIAFINVKRDLSELSNFNLSVGITKKFMDQVKQNPKADHIVKNPRSGEEYPLKIDGQVWTVGAVFDFIVKRAWETGEPGVIFLDRINEENPTPAVGEIEATNPCGEQPLLPYESCNLGSINVSKFVQGRKFDFDGFGVAIRLAIRFLDNVIDVNDYPIPETKAISLANRKIGLGIMGFADALFLMGIAYDSEDGIKFGEMIAQTLRYHSYVMSQELAEERGVFPNWQDSVWGKKGIKMRNAATTTQAPTGTISIIADCSGGIEPLFALSFWRNVLNGQRLAEVNPIFEQAAKENGVYSKELMEKLANGETVRHIDGLPADIKATFCTAHDIGVEWHIKMQAAFQRHCDASISKTINFPNSATVDQVRDIFQMAYDYKCKGVTVYRDGCRQNQPMQVNEKKEDPKKEEAPVEKAPKFAKKLRLPEVMSSIRIRQATPFGNMHVKIIVDPVTEREYEIFAQLGKGGEVASSDLEGMCRLISLFLRVNGSMDDIVDQLRGIGSNLSITSKDGRIESLADGLARAIQKYQKARDIAGLHSLLLGKTDLTELFNGSKASGHVESTKGETRMNDFKIKCPECKTALTFEEGCIKCHGCGYSQC
jgi:ribonucleoside-diphosphate reductase alpha chain